MPGSALPAAPRTAPKASYSGSRLSITLNTLSYSATSIIWPWPPFTSRWCSAIKTPITPCSAASVSPMLTPTRTGTRPGSAVRWRRPPMASPNTPKPGLCAAGPVCPKPLMRSMISFGLAACRASQPKPQRSRVPGLKFSISTSASSASARTAAWPSGKRRSSATLRLLRDCTSHHTLVPSRNSRHWRSGSPPCTGSILITSAPKSASVLPANGPAMSWPSSSTLRPCKASAVGSIGLLLVLISITTR